MKNGIKTEWLTNDLGNVSAKNSEIIFVSFLEIATTYSLLELKNIFKHYFNYEPCKALKHNSMRNRKIVLKEIVQQLCFNSPHTEEEIRALPQSLANRQKLYSH